MSDNVTNVFAFAVLAFMGVRLSTGLRRSRTVEGRALVWPVVRNIRWRHVWPVPLVLTAVVTAYVGLAQIPGLNWGWWSMLGGTGNPVFGESEATSGTVWSWIIPLVFVAMLIPALPLWAYAEERMFRTGAEDWSRPHRALKVLQFGLVHAIIGIPIGAALALSVGGAYFMWVYLRSYRSARDRQRATIESTTAHTVYNGLIMTLFAVAVVVDALG